jgi:DNA-binding GntR family transcriptional regulator
VPQLINADMAFHHFVYGLSDNLLVAPTMDAHWTYTQRVMGEVLMRDEKPRDIWDQHEDLLQSVVDGDPVAAEQKARQHIMETANFIIERLSAL